MAPAGGGGGGAGVTECILTYIRFRGGDLNGF